MLNLLLMRHATALPAEGQDYDRLLSPQGHQEARLIGEWIVAQDLIPDLALYSSAVRTRESSEEVRQAFSRDVPFIASDVMYAAPWTLLRDILLEASVTAKRVLVIAHNPGIWELANRLAMNVDSPARARLFAEFPPASLAVITFPTSFDVDLGVLEEFVTPADLGSCALA